MTQPDPAFESLARDAFVAQIGNPVALQHCLDQELSHEECFAELARLSLIAANAFVAQWEGQ